MDILDSLNLLPKLFVVAFPFGEVAQVDEQVDGLVVTIGLLGGNQVVYLSPEFRLLRCELVEVFGAGDCGLAITTRATWGLPLKGPLLGACP
ncbi:MAG: hypothetical protein ISS70_20460 [Phycisphaerae bacterium]|nr:hypothetical protein [Phycisphaerae bacterium]